jgi:hypothetical protein
VTGGDSDPFIWATRGRTWGFRFLRKGGHADPLDAYEAAFDGLGDTPDAFQRSARTVALRFPDPEGRCDSAGRVIPHEFVLSGPLVTSATSAAVAKELVWPLVAEEFDRVWDQPSR